MKILSVLCICSLLCACALGWGDVCCSSGYKKPGADIYDIEAMLDKCGQQKLKSSLPPNVYMNEFFKMDFCMEDHGFHSETGARQGCINNLPHGRLPVCVARGAYK